MGPLPRRAVHRTTDPVLGSREIGTASHVSDCTTIVTWVFAQRQRVRTATRSGESESESAATLLNWADGAGEMLSVNFCSDPPVTPIGIPQ